MSDRWQQNFDEICAYIKEHNCEISDIPYDVTTSNGITMQNWLKEQYTTYLGRSGRQMTDERRAVLHDFGIESYRNKFDNEFYKVLMDVKQYFDETGNDKIKKGVTFGKTTGIDLFAWVQIQRRKYKSGKLKQRYLEWIQQADLMFILENPFDTGYRHALEFQRTYGNLQMPVAYVCEDGFRLGKWCVAMRDRRNRGQAQEVQIEMLDALGFDWSTNNEKREMKLFPNVLIMSKLHTEFEDKDGLTHAEQYFSEHKNIYVPKIHICADGFPLGTWLEVLRLRLRSNGVSSEIADKLKEMGFNRNIIDTQRLSVQDKTGIACALEYYAYYHHLNVSESYTNGDFPLGEWLTNVRSRYTGGTLPAEIICKLQELYFIWDSSDINWFYNFDECRTFIKSHPDMPVPSELVSSSGTMLNVWYRNNHRAYEDGKLSPARAKLFSEIAVSSEQMQKNNARILWDRHWYDVKQYLERNPEYTIWNFPPRITGQHISNISAWLKAQIKEYYADNSRLDEQQREKLRQLGIDEGNQNRRVRKENTQKWHENCLKLKAFYEEHGHIDLPDEYHELRKWFLAQRGAIKRGAFSQKRIDFLTENGIIDLFKQPLRGNTVKLEVSVTKEQFDELMQKVEQERCTNISEYLIKLAKL